MSGNITCYDTCCGNSIFCTNPHRQARCDLSSDTECNSKAHGNSQPQSDWNASRSIEDPLYTSLMLPPILNLTYSDKSLSPIAPLLKLFPLRSPSPWWKLPREIVYYHIPQQVIGNKEIEILESEFLMFDGNERKREKLKRTISQLTLVCHLWAKVLQPYVFGSHYLENAADIQYMYKMHNAQNSIFSLSDIRKLRVYCEPIDEKARGNCELSVTRLPFRQMSQLYSLQLLGTHHHIFKHLIIIPIQIRPLLGKHESLFQLELVDLRFHSLTSIFKLIIGIPHLAVLVLDSIHWDGHNTELTIGQYNQIGKGMWKKFKGSAYNCKSNSLGGLISVSIFFHQVFPASISPFGMSLMNQICLIYKMPDIIRSEVRFEESGECPWWDVWSLAKC